MNFHLLNIPSFITCGDSQSDYKPNQIHLSDGSSKFTVRGNLLAGPYNYSEIKAIVETSYCRFRCTCNQSSGVFHLGTTSENNQAHRSAAIKTLVVVVGGTAASPAAQSRRFSHWLRTPSGDPPRSVTASQPAEAATAAHQLPYTQNTNYTLFKWSRQGKNGWNCFPQSGRRTP